MQDRFKPSVHSSAMPDAKSSSTSKMIGAFDLNKNGDNKTPAHLGLMTLPSVSAGIAASCAQLNLIPSNLGKPTSSQSPIEMLAKPTIKISTNNLLSSDPFIQSATDFLTEQGVHAADKILKGSGKVISPAVTAFFVAQNGAARASALRASGTSVSESITCGVVGGATETYIYGGANTALWTAGISLLPTGPTGFDIGRKLLTKGPEIIQKGSIHAGDIAQGACQKLFRHLPTEPQRVSAPPGQNTLEQLRGINFRNNQFRY